MMRMGAAQLTALAVVRFRPWNKYVAAGMETSANMMNPMEPIRRPSLSFPLVRKITEKRSPEVRVSPIIGTVTSRVLESMFRTVLSTVVD